MSSFHKLIGRQKKRKNLWKSKKESLILWSCWAKWFLLEEKRKGINACSKIASLYWRQTSFEEISPFSLGRMKLWTQKNLKEDLQLKRVDQNSWESLPFRRTKSLHSASHLFLFPTFNTFVHLFLWQPSNIVLVKKKKWTYLKATSLFKLMLSKAKQKMAQARWRDKILSVFLAAPKYWPPHRVRWWGGYIY